MNQEPVATTTMEPFTQEDLYTMTAHGVAWFIEKRNDVTGRVCLRRVRRNQGMIGLETRVKWVTPVKGSASFPAFLRKPESVGNIWLRTAGGNDWFIKLADDHLIVKASQRDKYKDHATGVDLSKRGDV